MSGRRRVSGKFVDIYSDNPISGPVEGAIIPGINEVWIGDNNGYVFSSSCPRAQVPANSNSGTLPGIVTNRFLYQPIGQRQIPALMEDTFRLYPAENPAAHLEITTRHARVQCNFSFRHSSIGAGAINSSIAWQIMPMLIFNLLTWIDGVPQAIKANSIRIAAQNAAAPATNELVNEISFTIVLPGKTSGAATTLQIGTAVFNGSDKQLQVAYESVINTF